MTAQIISAQSFVKAMALPDDQRREMLESLGAKMMVQLSVEAESRQQSGPNGNLALDSN